MSKTKLKAGDKAWLSKNALTNGVMECVVTGAFGGRIRTTIYHWKPFTAGKDVHATRAEAVAAAEEMRKRRIESLRKQIADLEALTF
jgi:uncharacterized membrane protein YeiH